MEVILRDDIDNLGSCGDVVKVANGYARNFLLPKRLAVVATDGNKKIVAQEKEAHLRRQAKLQGEAEELAKLMTGTKVTIQNKAGAENQLFGSVTAQNIADALAKAGYTVDRKKIQLDEHIKVLGEYTVAVKLHRNVSVDIAVRVENEDGEIPVLEAPEPEPEPKPKAAAPAETSEAESGETEPAAESDEADEAEGDEEAAAETE